MSCCKGHTATCDDCGFKGCDHCQVHIHTLKGSFCYSCDSKRQNQKEIERLEARNQELKDLLLKNNIQYPLSDDEYSWEVKERGRELRGEPPIPPYDFENDLDCKVQ